MERASISALRHCMRSGNTLRCQTTTFTSRKCIATPICPYSQTTTLSITTSSIPISRKVSNTNRVSIPKLSKARKYSTTPSSPLGSIGEGEAGSTSTLTTPSHLNEQELEIWELLHKELEPTELEVQDISGGCGSMYGIEIVSPRFEGLGMLKQQRLVNQVLGDRVKAWHGVQLRTRSS